MKKKNPFPDDQGRPICFVKFHSATHDIELIDNQGRANLESTLVFEVAPNVEGHPVIDLWEASEMTVSELRPVGGQPVTPVPKLKEIPAPGGVTKYSCLDVRCTAGSYTLKLSQKGSKKRQVVPFFPEGPKRNDPYGEEYEAVRLFLRMSDVDLLDGYYGTCSAGHEVERRYGERLSMERYVPANLEFDDYPVTIHLSAPQVQTPFLVHSGCSSDTSSPWTISFQPDAVPFPFVFLGENAGASGPNFMRKEVDYVRSDSSRVSFEVFGHRSRWERANVDQHATDALAAMPALELHLGRCPYPAIKLYSASEAMEYSGAAEVAGSHVAHELSHMWFGRHVRPASGDAGWIDEAIAHWCEEFAMSPNPPYRGSNMGKRSDHHRGTAALDARRVGKPLLEFINHRINHETGRTLGQFLQQFRPGTRIESEDLERALWEWSGIEFKPLFDKFVRERVPVSPRPPSLPRSDLVRLRQLLKDLIDDWDLRKRFYADPFRVTADAQLSPEERGMLFTMNPEDLADVESAVCHTYIDDDWRLDGPDAPPPPGTWIPVPPGMGPMGGGLGAFAAERQAWSGPAPEVRRVWPSVLPQQWNKPLILCGEGLHYQGTVHLRPIPAGGNVISLAVEHYVARNFRQIYLITEPLRSTVAYVGEFTVGVVNFASPSTSGYVSPLIPALHTLRII